MKGTATKTLRGQRREPLAWRRALLCMAAVAALSLSAVERGFAENPWAKSRNAWGSSPNAWGNSKTPWANSRNSWGRSPSPKAGNGAANNFGGYMAIPSEGISALPSMEPRDGKYIDTGAIPDGLQAPRRPAKRTARRRPSGVPASNEKGSLPAKPSPTLPICSDRTQSAPCIAAPN